MRQLFSLAAVIAFALPTASLTAISAQPARPVITIKTEHVGLTLAVGADGRLYQAGFGPAESPLPLRGSPAHPCKTAAPMAY